MDASSRSYFEKNERFATAGHRPHPVADPGRARLFAQLGVVHRDIKPSNVFLLPDGRSRSPTSASRISSRRLTQVGTVLGTPAYMSPEQILGLPVDGRSDLFSVGVILYQFLTGERPFTGNATITMRKVLEEDPLPPSRFNVQIPGAMDAVVRRALAKKPDERLPVRRGVRGRVDAGGAGATREQRRDDVGAAAPPVARGTARTLRNAAGARSRARRQSQTAARRSWAARFAVVASWSCGDWVRRCIIAVARRRRRCRPRRRPNGGRTAGGSAPATGSTLRHRPSLPPAPKVDPRRTGHLCGRPRRSERGALPGRPGADAGGPARGFARPARGEGARTAGRQGFVGEELRLCATSSCRRAANS